MPVGYSFEWSKKWVSRPRGQHIIPINVKFGTGDRTVGSLPSAEYQARLSVQCGNTAPKPPKFGILPRNFHLRSDSFAQFLRNSPRLYESIGIAFMFLIWSLSGDGQPSYKKFPLVGAFSHIFLGSGSASWVG